MKPISATSASDTHCPSWSSNTAFGYRIVVHASSGIELIAAVIGLVLAGGDRELGSGPAGGGDHVPAVERAVRPEHHRPGHPALDRVVTRASATNRAAPRAEFADPFRSRVATITGADDAVDAVARNAFKPFTPEYPYPAPCLAYP